MAKGEGRDRGSKNVKRPKKSELEKKALKSVVGESSTPVNVDVVPRKRKPKSEEDEE